MGNMKTDDWARATKEMESMNPDQMAQQGAAMGQQRSQQQQYILSVSVADPSPHSSDAYRRIG